MANIDPYLQNINTAIYGEDVRSSIHDAIYVINNEVDVVNQNVSNYTNSAKTYAQEAEIAVNEVQTIVDNVNISLSSNTPIASPDILGLVKIGEGLGIQNDGKLYANSTTVVDNITNMDIDAICK